MTEIPKNKMLDDLIEQAKVGGEKYGINFSGKNLTDIEKTYIWEQVAIALDENVAYYLDETTSDAMGEETPNSATFTAYSKRADYEVRDGQFIVFKKDVQPGILDGYNPTKIHDYTKAEEMNLLYEILLENNKAGKRFTALEKYYDYLVSAESGLDLSTDKKSVFEREIATLCKQSYENYLMEKYSEIEPLLPQLRRANVTITTVKD